METHRPEPRTAASRAPPEPMEAAHVQGDVQVELEAHAAAPAPLSSDELLKVLARAGVLFFRFSANEGLTFLTSNVEQVLGYTKEELFADPELVAKVVDPEFLPALERISPSFFVVHEEAVRLEVPLIAKDGSRVLLEARVVPDIAPYGAVTGFFGVAVQARPPPPKSR